MLSILFNNLSNTIKELYNSICMYIGPIFIGFSIITILNNSTAFGSSPLSFWSIVFIFFAGIIWLIQVCNDNTNLAIISAIFSIISYYAMINESIHYKVIGIVHEQQKQQEHDQKIKDREINCKLFTEALEKLTIEQKTIILRQPNPCQN